jgi:hypothetical protein
MARRTALSVEFSERTLRLLQQIDPQDLDRLMRAGPRSVLGRITRLNRSPRYHNSLDALRWCLDWNELRACWRVLRKGLSRDGFAPGAGPSCDLPGSSGSTPGNGR